MVFKLLLILLLGTFTIQNVTATPTGESSTVKLKARVNIHGIFSICSATMLEKQTSIVNDQNEAEQKAEKSISSNSPKDNKPKQEEPMESENAGAPNGEVNSHETNEEKSGEKQVKLYN